MSRSCSAAMIAAPERGLPIAPSRERVPSGKRRRFQPSSSSSIHVVGRALAHAAAVAADRHGVEEERDAVGLPALLVEVVGRRGDRRALAPLARERAQDHRRVEVAGVVDDEDDRLARLLQQVLAHRARARVEVDHRPEDEVEDHQAGGLRVPAAGPRHVHLLVGLGDLGAQTGAAVAQLRDARLHLARPGAALLDDAVDPSVPHGLTYSGVFERFRIRCPTRLQLQGSAARRSRYAAGSSASGASSPAAASSHAMRRGVEVGRAAARPWPRR